MKQTTDELIKELEHPKNPFNKKYIQGKLQGRLDILEDLKEKIDKLYCKKISKEEQQELFCKISKEINKIKEVIDEGKC